MEQGDLTAWVQPRLVLVLEGVLADVTETTTGRFRKVRTRSFNWLPTPIKRVAYLKHRWPNTVIEVVTFLDQQAADEAADFFDTANIPISQVSYHPLDRWVREILWQSDLQTIYDSDIDRIMRYGQRGFVVQKGKDFS